MRLALLLLALLPGLVWGAIGTPVSCGTNSKSTANGSDPLTVTLATAIAAGDEIIVLVAADGNRSVTGVSDTGSNTYTSGGAANSGTLTTDVRTVVFRARCSVALGIGDTVVVANSGIGDATDGIVAEVVKVSGVSNATDATGTASGDTGDPTGSVTTVGASTIVFVATVVELGSAPTYDESLGWTALAGVAAEGSVGLSFHTAYRTFSSAGAQTYDPEVSGADTTDWSMSLMSLAESSSSPNRFPHLVPMTGAGL